MTITATDIYGDTEITTFDFDVQDNTAPTFDDIPFVRVLDVGEGDSILINVSDVDGDTMTVDIPSPPAWSTWTPNTLSIATGATTAAEAGNHTVAVEVCDEHGACTVDSFIIVVN